MEQFNLSLNPNLYIGLISFQSLTCIISLGIVNAAWSSFSNFPNQIQNNGAQILRITHKNDVKTKEKPIVRGIILVRNIRVYSSSLLLSSRLAH